MTFASVIISINLMRTLCTDLHLALLVCHAQPVVGLVLPHVGGQQPGAAVRIAGIVSLKMQS